MPDRWGGAQRDKCTKFAPKDILVQMQVSIAKILFACYR